MASLSTAKITDLPFELLENIIDLIPYIDKPPLPNGTVNLDFADELGCQFKGKTNRRRILAPLRQTCHAFDEVVQPILFSEITFDCLHTRLEIVRLQISSLANEKDGPWRKWTKTLKILNLDPCYDGRPIGGLQYWIGNLNAEQRKSVKDVREIVSKDLVPSLQTSLPELESVIWFTRSGDPIRELASHFSKVKKLSSLKLIFWNDSVVRDFPLDAFSDLRELSLTLYLDGISRTLHKRWLLEAKPLMKKLHRVVESSPRMTFLSVAKRHPDALWENSSTVFPDDFLLTPTSRSLRHLALHHTHLKVNEDESPPYDFYRRLVSNLPSLTSVVLMKCEGYGGDAFWSAIFQSNTLLSSIKVDRPTPALMEYLQRPDVPLESLTLFLSRFSTYDCSLEKVRDMAFQTYSSVLKIHASTLKHLDIPASYQVLWWLEVSEEKNLNPFPSLDIEDRLPRDGCVYLEQSDLFHCGELRALGVVLDARRTTSDVSSAVSMNDKVQFLQHVSSLEKLETVTIYCPYPYKSDGPSYYQIQGDIASAIEGFRIAGSDRARFAFEVLFMESRYQMVAFDVEGDGGNMGDRAWRFVDINAEPEDDFKDNFEEVAEEDVEEEQVDSDV
ncbi:hypothetical protein DFP72DRAFT_879886 [Ephemerocybe angulata]|uniref:Uncharacterized protein n=1 Tax=Ephemerocybe angulata TaxID=980116 RepID=A0A8H6MDF3_9AGAR|nr:hypothetical protein DFP72DRAFT_879886 [Tulosesus angulatus]